MADGTAIEWTDATWNPIRARFWQIQNDGSGKERIGWHCEHVSEGCRNCYAEGFNFRLGTGQDFAPANFKDPATKPGYRNGDVEVYLCEKTLLAPLAWKRPRKIFVGSMTDLFARFVKDEWLDKIFAVMALCPQHTFQILTKRPDRMLVYSHFRKGMGNPFICKAINQIPAAMGNRKGALEMPLPNVWLGTSVENRVAIPRIDVLRETPAAKRFLSIEPLLEELGRIDLTGIDWAIAGGESGPHARPMHPSWVRTLREQCETFGVPFFFKQWGKWGPIDHSEAAGEAGLRGRGVWKILFPNGYHEHPNGRWPNEARGEVAIVSVGKKAAGALLDGIEHKAFPDA